MDFLKRFPLILIFAGCMFGCAKNLSPDVKAGENRQAVIGGALNNMDKIEEVDHFIMDLAGTEERIDLAENEGRPTVLLFSGYFCASCVKEHNEIVNSMKDAQAFLKSQKVNFYTYIVGMDINNPVHKAKILKWKKQNNIPWPISGDPNNNLFMKYCRGDQTPCTLASVPNKKPVSITGRLGIEDLKRLVGDWNGPEVEPNPLPTPGPSNGNTAFGKFITGAYPVLDEKNLVANIVLTPEIPRRTLVMFATYDCSGCIHEHEEINKLLEAGDETLKNTDIYTVLLDYDLEKEADVRPLQKWKNDHHVSWKLIADPSMADGSYKIFDKFCKGTLTPCASVFKPGKGLTFSSDNPTVEGVLAELKK